MVKSKRTPTKIVLRRAKAEDVVNVFKLVKRQSENADIRAAENNHAAIAYTLDVIERGMVIVADLSGRLVGVIGCEAPVTIGDKPTYVIAFEAIAADFEATGARDALFRKLCAYAKKGEFGLRIPIGNSVTDEQRKELLGPDFGLVLRIYELGASPVVEVPLEEPKDEDATDEPETDDVPQWFKDATAEGVQSE